MAIQPQRSKGKQHLSDFFVEIPDKETLGLNGKKTVPELVSDTKEV